MKRKYNVLFVSPEVVPFAKTGGLADVSGALPYALSEEGQEVKVVMPKYASVDENKFNLKVAIQGLKINVAGRETTYSVKSFQGKKDGPEFLFVDCPEFFNRESLYVDPSTGTDWPDNAERFIMFSKAVFEIAKRINFRPDIIHANDWQSGLAIAYLKTLYAGDKFFKNTKGVYSIHNIAYQGNFPESDFVKLGLGPEYFYPMSPFEYWGKVSFMKAGIYFADVINTVSETYAKEIQSSNEYGYGMEGILKSRSKDLFGIVNGIDYAIWNPQTDDLIADRYSTKNLEGKKKNKQALLKQVGLPVTKKDIPLIGMISRLADQKGFDLIASISAKLLALNLKIVLLGTGQEKYHKLFTKLQKKYPRKLSANLAFDNQLAHLIEAGADMFLMPSRYEPCGLNQLYSLKYGTIPIVRKTGGLADTIEDYHNGGNGGTGFVFEKYDSSELLKTVKRALEVYKDNKAWEKLILKAMSLDYSWERSAGRYIDLYTRAMENKSTAPVSVVQ